MISKKNKINQNSTIRVKANTIKLDDCTLQMSSINQLRLGDIPYEYPCPILALLLIFIALKISGIFITLPILLIIILSLSAYAYHNYTYKNMLGLNFKLNTGEVYTFVTENKEFSKKVLDLISDIMTEKSPEADYSISFQGNGEIIDEFEKNKKLKEEAQKKELENETAKMKTHTVETSEIVDLEKPLVTELNKLYLYYTEADEVDADILKLIKNTIQFALADDTEHMRINYEKFITYGLIKGCNELSLNLLIAEIIANIY